MVVILINSIQFIPDLYQYDSVVLPGFSHQSTKVTQIHNVPVASTAT